MFGIRHRPRKPETLTHMRLTILTQYYPPEVGAPQNRLSELAQEMVKHGHAVTVLTAMPNYPTGKIYPGYGRLLRRETLNGVRVIRTFIYPTQKADLLHRMANYLSFVASSALFGTFLLARSEYLLVESPPLFLGISAFWLSRLKRARLIFNVSDLWPESAVRLGMLRKGSLPYKLSAWLEAFCYRQAWTISGQSKSILASINRRFPAQRTFHLSNGVDTNRFNVGLQTDTESGSGLKVRPHNRLSVSASGEDEELIVLYVGLHGLAQGLGQVLGAAEALRGEGELGGLSFVLVGDGPEKKMLVLQAEEHNLSNVSFYDPVPSADVPALLAQADVILVPLKMYIPGAVPSKLYEAMATGKPVILVAEGEAADIVRRHNAGLVVQPGDVEGLTGALRLLKTRPDLRKQLGENGRMGAVQEFDRSHIVVRFMRFLEGNLG